MKKTSFADMNCAIAQSLEIVGEWWTMLILRDAFFGVRRFDDWIERLGISRNVLTTRLNTLVESGLMERRTYDEGRGRHDYVLTEKGRALWPVMVSLRQWGDEWILGEGNEPVHLEHNGHVATASLHCDVCGEHLTDRNIKSVPRPGDDRLGNRTD